MEEDDANEVDDLNNILLIYVEHQQCFLPLLMKNEKFGAPFVDVLAENCHICGSFEEFVDQEYITNVSLLRR